ncbi:hypothetical protein [Embleya sp. NPDC059259]|uniref:hypothetical protein n=1 Tax=unclassified Embleya TaxID=2699296 RepID=UPI0036A085A4
MRDADGDTLVAEECLDQIHGTSTGGAPQALARAGLLRVRAPGHRRGPGELRIRPPNGCADCGCWGITRPAPV